MICKCKLPIIRGYEPELYCLRCGLKLKIKTMKKIKDVIKLKKGYKFLNNYGNLITSGNWDLTKEDNEWFTNSKSLKFSETTIRENPELFEDVYEETERKKICVEIELNEINGYPKVKFEEVQTALKSHFCHTDRNIKVTEIKLPEISKEDVEWLYDKFACSFRTLDTVWAEFQAKKEAEKNG